jgi:DNA-directed RNA polymerase II subunit RPB7
MFYIKRFIHKLSLNPKFIGQNIQNLIYEYLLKHVEGTCTASGYIISVLQIERVSEGKILVSGQISFEIQYQALILKPVTGEIIDAKIESISTLGYFATVGPLSIFISNYQIPPKTQDKLKDNDLVRLKIIGIKIDSTKVYAIGTLNDDFLGVIS